VRAGTERHFDEIAKGLARGTIVPFLGAGANLCDRVTGESWRLGCGFLPSGAELAEHLADSGDYPVQDRRDLMQVAQWIAWREGVGGLYRLLREVFDRDYSPTSLHRWLAREARALDAEGRRQLLVVTMNYDDLVERAFGEEGLACDVVWYEANPRGAGEFVHQPPDREPQLIQRPTTYQGLPSTLERPVVLKLHGSVVRTDETHDSYVITEDDYIDYLLRGDLRERLPIPLVDTLARSNLLFLGYSLSADWDMRAFIKNQFALSLRSWSVLRLASDPGRRDVEVQLWRSLENTDLVPYELRDYVQTLSAREPDARRFYRDVAQRGSESGMATPQSESP
jgi:hypothetical protein